MNNEILKNPKIEAIYPLSIMQTGLLFHYLTEKDDQGFLNVQCTINGELDTDILKKSWDLVIERHPVLRTSVHWEKIKSPVQLVKPNGTIHWNILDWSHLTTSDQEKKLNELKKNNKQNGIDFQKNPLSKIILIKTNVDSYYLVWPCHHLLLDGWSSSIIIKDVFTFYNALITNKKPELQNIPTYKSYLNWQKKIDIAEAKEFWKKTFKEHELPFLFNHNQLKKKTLAQNDIELSKETSLKVQELAKAYQTTLNTIFQAIWSLIISKYSNSKDVTYGNVVSGRSGDFPSIELIAGMFTNVIPVRSELNVNYKIKDWLKTLQLQQLEARKYEHITIGEISDWIDNKANNLFDSLFIFENYPWKDIQSGNIKVHSPKSGITTTYPLTLTIKAGDLIHINLLSDESLFSNEQNSWILNRFEEIISILDNNKDISIESLLQNITPILTGRVDQIHGVQEKTNSIVAPKNKTEVKLLEIWQTLLNNDNISTNDNFFEIGGKSLLAVRMFSMIKNRMNIQLSPTTVLVHPTITSLAKKINDESGLETENWNNVVPIRSEGNKQPIFCLHAGGGHVFFYNPLAKYLDKKRPVYAIQPSGLYGDLPRHQSIEEMAIDYVKEIRLACPEGPYNLIVYCHSTAVGFEMSNLLKSMGNKVNLIVMDTMAEQEHITSERLKMRVLGFLNRLSNKPVNVIKTMISYRFKKYINPFFINIFGSTEAKNTSNTAVNLINIYNKYKWKSYDIDIILVLTKKVNKLFNQEISESWNKLTDKVNTLNIEGDHRTLFEDPDVKYVAKMLEEYLD
jgi:thioesterase domain-containing protein/acyl carrier protein/predicted XRE-type DNA-binding protein